MRELASIYRSDHTLLVSDFEKKLLVDKYGMPPSKFSLAPFFYDTINKQKLPTFNRRKDFVMIGNFRHLPNKDQFKWVKNELWPRIHEKLPDAFCYVYGAYPDKETMNSSVEAKNFVVKGPTKDQYATLKKYKVNLAPLRYGAGIKG